MIEPTDEMVQAFLTGARPSRLWADGDPDWRAGLAAVLAIVARDHVILPRGAQALCCSEHPETPVRWGVCPVCLSQMPPEERT